MVAVAAVVVVVVLEAVNYIILSPLILHRIGEAGHVRRFADGGSRVAVVG